MAKEKLTERKLDALRSEASASGKAIYVWDTHTKNLGARISPTGNVSWLFQKWIGGRDGKAKRITLNGVKTLDEARKQAEIENGDFAKGVDIFSRKLESKKRQKAIILAETLEAVVNVYLERNAKDKSPNYWKEVTRIFRSDVIPTLGKATAIPSITKAQIRNLIEYKLYGDDEDEADNKTPRKGAPGVARYMFAALSPFFEWCVERDIIKVSPMAGMKPPPLPKARDRILTDEEIKAFWLSSGELGYPFGPLFRLLLLTAQRRDEVASMHREEIDLAKGEWVIPSERTKNSKAHIVHLSPQAVAIIENLPPLDSAYVFTTTLKAPVSGWSKAKRKLDSLMEQRLDKDIKPWRVHDLRRTAASGMAALGINSDMIERVLNHLSGAQGGLKGVYQRYDYLEQRKDAIFAWDRTVEEITDER